MLYMKKEVVDEKFDPSNLFFENFKYDKWYKIYKEESKSQPEETITQRVKLRRQKEDVKDLSYMQPLEVYEEKKRGKGLKVFASNQLSTRIPILSVQIKAGNN